MTRSTLGFIFDGLYAYVARGKVLKALVEIDHPKSANHCEINNPLNKAGGDADCKSTASPGHDSS